MDHLDACAALDEEIERFAGQLSVTAPETPVASCPGWTVADLALHLGTVHRWADHLVRVRASSRIPAAEMGLSPGPAEPAWIRQGGRALVTTLQRADPSTPMWSWGTDQHAAFWSRRQLHETLVHRMDLELAAGVEPQADTEIATDAIDELLSNLAPAAAFSPAVTRLRGDGERLGFRASDTGAAWSVTLEPEGFSLRAGLDRPVAAVLSGDALSLLLVLYRRRPSQRPTVSVDGDAQLVQHWIEHSAVQ